MIIIDASDSEAESQLEVTEKLVYDLGASGKPTLLVLNKCDKCTEISSKLLFRAKFGGTVAISALDGRGVDNLIEELEKLALAGKRYCVFHIPYSDQNVISQLYKVATVEDTEYGDGYITVCAVADEKVVGQYKKYLAK
jgi:GTP-binding protein HflX